MMDIWTQGKKTGSEVEYCLMMNIWTQGKKWLRSRILFYPGQVSGDVHKESKKSLILKESNILEWTE